MKKKDYLIISCILVCALILFLLINVFKKPGSGVKVIVDGKEELIVEFSAEGRYEINNGTNILIIKDGYAYLEDATCPDKLCVKQGKVSKEGESIICLPNKVVVIVYGQDSEVDIY